MRGTAFNADADRLDQALIVGSVYHISKGTLKTANTKFSSLRAAYEITFNRDTEVEFVGDDAGIEQVHFEYV